MSHLRPPDSESVSGLKKKAFKIYPPPHSHHLMILKHTHILNFTPHNNIFENCSFPKGL